MSQSVIVNLESKQPYFRAFCLAKRLRNGDTWKSTDYMNWIENKHIVFRYIHAKDYPDNWMPLLKEHNQLFQDWLFDEARKEAANET